MTILDFNESVRTLVGRAAARLRGTRVWEIIDYNGDRALERFEAQLLSDDGADPGRGHRSQHGDEGAVRRIFAIRDLRERRAAEQRILFLAHFDTLTGLPNRASFQDRLENDIAAMKARNGELALMIIDLDRFKEINDVHGHAAGDELLKARPPASRRSCRTASSPPGSAATSSSSSRPIATSLPPRRGWPKSSWRFSLNR